MYFRCSSVLIVHSAQAIAMGWLLAVALGSFVFVCPYFLSKGSRFMGNCQIFFFFFAWRQSTLFGIASEIVGVVAEGAWPSRWRMARSASTPSANCWWRPNWWLRCTLSSRWPTNSLFPEIQFKKREMHSKILCMKFQKDTKIPSKKVFVFLQLLSHDIVFPAILLND